MLLLREDLNRLVLLTMTTHWLALGLCLLQLLYHLLVVACCCRYLGCWLILGGSSCQQSFLKEILLLVKERGVLLCEPTEVQASLCEQLNVTL